jgi:DnaJ homolog subfamily B member 13
MGNPPELYHKILNIPKDTSPQELRAAYKSLVKKWHPDKHPPSSRPEAEARFKAISEAYEVRLRSGGGVPPPCRAHVPANRVHVHCAAPWRLPASCPDDVASPFSRAQALLDQQENRAVFGPCNGGRAGGGAGARVERTRSDGFCARSAPGTPARELKKVYSAGNPGGRRAFAEFSSCIVRKAPPLERRLECTLEELCRGCSKEVTFTRDVVTRNG